MGGTKRWAQDKVFSEYIRTRDNWTCQRCQKYYNPEESNKRMGLHCSHYYGRGKWSVRFDPDNAVALCYGCHRYLGSNPADHLDFIKKRLGKEKFDRLIERKNMIAKRKDFLNKEFLNELKLMLEDENS